MVNLFQKINQLASKFLSGSSGNGVVGVDFSAGSIKVVQLKNSAGSPELETYGELSLGPYTDVPISADAKPSSKVLHEALTDILHEAKVTTNKAGVSIPLSTSLINTLELPPVSDKAKLAEIVPIEARKYIPVPTSEVLLDWHLVGDLDNQDDSPPEALVVAIHKESINRFRSVLEDTDLDVGFFEIEIFSTIRSTLDRGIDPVLIIDLGLASTKIYIVEHGIIRGSHSINQGGQDITKALATALDIDFIEAESLKREHGLSGEGEDAEALRNSARGVLEFVFSRAEEIVEDYQKEHGVVVEETVLSGGGAVLSGIETIAREVLETEVSRADPFAKIKTPQFLDATLTEIGPEFAVAVGAALRRLREG